MTHQRLFSGGTSRLTAPVNNWRGRPILYSGSPIISFNCAIHPTVRAKARLLDGSEIDFEASGLLARALQHEVDHLHGVLFIDRMNSSAKASVAGRLKRLQQRMSRR